MFLGYNTNGFAHHRLEDAIEILAELGYRGVALTPDFCHLYLNAADSATRIGLCEQAMSQHRLHCVVETGARFILDIRRKHQPTLIGPTPEERRRRLGFLEACTQIAVGVRAEIVSFWSGTATDDAYHSELMARLVEGCKRLADTAAEKNVRLAFEPEPGMFIDTMDKFAELHAKVNHPAFGLTVDVGHLVCQGELPVSRHLAAWKHVLWNVHIEDMRRGVHDHVMFGEGEVDFGDVFAGLHEANYTGGVYVELSRHSYDAVNAACKSFQFLQPYFPADSAKPESPSDR